MQQSRGVELVILLRFDIRETKTEEDSLGSTADPKAMAATRQELAPPVENRRLSGGIQRLDSGTNLAIGYRHVGRIQGLAPGNLGTKSLPGARSWVADRRLDDTLRT